MISWPCDTACEELDPPEGVPELAASISPLGEDMAQSREALDDFGQHQRRAVSVQNVGGVDFRMDEIAIGVGQDVALAALGLFACIIAPRSAAFCGLALGCRLPRRWGGFATRPPHGRSKAIMGKPNFSDEFKRDAVSQITERVMGCRSAYRSVLPPSSQYEPARR